jgi:hypothetical protein
MFENGVKIERAQLYKQVWSKPMSKLAKDYGISDVGLKKICKKLNVPTPPRGYWARTQSGQKPNRARLPKLKHGNPDFHILEPKSNMNLVTMLGN